MLRLPLFVAWSAAWLLLHRWRTSAELLMTKVYTPHPPHAQARSWCRRAQTA